MIHNNIFKSGQSGQSGQTYLAQQLVGVLFVQKLSSLIRYQYQAVISSTACWAALCNAEMKGTNVFMCHTMSCVVHASYGKICLVPNTENGGGVLKQHFGFRDRRGRRCTHRHFSLGTEAGRKAGTRHKHDQRRGTSGVWFQVNRLAHRVS